MEEKQKPMAHPQPPPSWRDRFVHTLPYYTGPYAVGYMEMELPVDDPRTFSRIKRQHKHALRLDTVLFSMYYPSTLDPEADPKTQSRVPWLPRPRIPTCKGYAKEFSIPFAPVTVYIGSTSMFTKMPAFRNARLAVQCPAGTSGSEEKGEQPTFPVIIFSHGLGGSRTMYSTICGELASFGFVVVAMESRDGSGARTYVNVPPDKDSPELARSKSLSDMKDATKEKKETTRNYKVDYIFPKDNPQDTSPINSKGVDRELRASQIEMRLAEVQEAFKALQMMNAGKGQDISKMNLRKKGMRGASSKGLDGVVWDDWKGRLHLDNVTAMGHSFGGATTVQILRLDKDFPWIGQGILLDAWGPATPDVPDGSEQHITKPLLSIGSEAFMHWKENFNRIEEICKEAKERNPLCWMLTIRGSTHLSQTDFAVLYPKFMSLLLKTLVHPARAMYLNVVLTLEFLKIVLPPDQTKFNTSWVSEDFLKKRQQEAPITSDHKPDEKWTAARLKIDHEFRLRLTNWLTPKKKIPENVPTDAAGKPLVGLKNFGGKEVWTHLSPDQAEVERHMDHEKLESDSANRPEFNERCPTM